jgi:hypothetical protein
MVFMGFRVLGFTDWKLSNINNAASKVNTLSAPFFAHIGTNNIGICPVAAEVLGYEHIIQNAK